MTSLKKGEKEKLVELAAKNASIVLNTDKERLKREEGRTIGAMKEIGSSHNIIPLFCENRPLPFRRPEYASPD